MSAGKALSCRYRAAIANGSDAERRSLRRVAVLVYGPAVEVAVIEVEPEVRDEARQLARLGVLSALEEAAREGALERARGGDLGPTPNGANRGKGVARKVSGV